MSQVPQIARTLAALRALVGREPKELAKLVPEMRKDYQILFAEGILRALVRCTKVDVKADVDDPRARVLASNLLEVWKKTIKHALDAIAYGRVAFERLYAYDQAANLWKVAPPVPLPFTMTKLDQADRNDPRLVVKFQAPGTEAIALSMDEAWWFALDGTPFEPHGKSRFLGAPLEVWKDRKLGKKLGEIWLGRYAIGHGVARAPAADERPDPVTAAGDVREINQVGQLVNPLKELLDRIQETESGGTVVLPSTRDESGGYLWDYEQSPGLKDGSSVTNHMQALDVRVLRAFLIPERAVTQDAATGSYGMSETHRKVLELTVNDLVESFVDGFQRGIVEPAEALNFGGLRVGLKITADLIDDDARRLIVDSVGKMLTGQLSPLVSFGALDLARLLEVSGIPVSENLPAAIEAMSKAAAEPKPSPFPMSTAAPTEEETPAAPEPNPADAKPSLWESLAKSIVDRPDDSWGRL